MSQSLRSLPAGAFGAVMGLAGLGLAARARGWPPAFSEGWIALALVALAALLPAYLAKLLRHPQAVRAELASGALVGFCATLPVGMTLVAAGLAPHAPQAAQLLWWTGVPLFLLVQAWAIGLVLRGRVARAQVSGAWLIVLVGGIVTPFAGLPLGHPAPSVFLFAFSAAVAPLAMAAILHRVAAGPVLPEALRPSLFILLVPPSLIYVNGAALWPGAPAAALEWLYFAALPLAAALLVFARRFHRWPFGVSWWAFTFPLDALAGAAARFAADHPGGGWAALADALLALATAAVLLVLVRSLRAFARGTLFSAAA